MNKKLNKKTNVGALSVRNTRKNLPNCAQKGNRGITLVALIITIIVLLILAVVAIRAVSNDGIISHAKNARAEYEKAQVNEQTTLEGYLGTIEENIPGVIPEGGVYKHSTEWCNGLCGFGNADRKAGDYCPCGSITFTKNPEILTAGDFFPTAAANYDIYEEGDYKYTYNYSSISGWNVEVTDKTKTTYGEILSEIAGKPVTNMSSTFANCINLTTAPTIPDGVTIMNGAFAECRALITAPVIPNSVINMEFTFTGCSSLTTAPAIPSSVKNMSCTFDGCRSLAGTIEINANPTSYTYCLRSTQITGITGSCSEETKAALMATK